MNLDVAFYGVLIRDAERKSSAAGRPYLRMNVRVGTGDFAQFPQVMVFDNVDQLAERLRKDSRVYIEGQGNLEAWLDRDGKPRATLKVLSSRCIETHLIGQKKP